MEQGAHGMIGLVLAPVGVRKISDPFLGHLASKQSTLHRAVANDAAVVGAAPVELAFLLDLAIEQAIAGLQ